MNILIFGATGMLGHAVFRVLSSDKRLTVFGTIRSESSKKLFPPALADNLIPNIDIESHDCLKKAFEISRPEVVINCIGIIKQLSDAKDVLKTIPINTLLPHRLAALSKDFGSRLILVSTDCVFSGAKGNYLETDFPDCDDLYGRSKLLGEITDNDRVLTIRTSIIGHELRGGHSLVNWFLSQSGSAQGYTQAIFSGLPTNELAKIILDCIIQWPELNGLYHVSADPINKYDLLDLIAKAYKKDINISKNETVKIDRSLNHAKFSMATGYKAQNWNTLITSMKEFNQDSPQHP
ncbi:MAG: SDR family oxidoreductase [Polynucleobacter sp.]|nr:SDR family oxidoreductase [Polynucleobacter sp.]